MPRRKLNTKAATTWRKDSSQIGYQMVQENRPYRLDARKIRRYVYHDYQQKSGSYLPAEKTPQQKQGVRSRLKLIWEEFASSSSSEFSIEDLFHRKLCSHARGNNQPPLKTQNRGSEEVVTKPKIIQCRNHVGRRYPRKCKPQRAENPTVRVSRNGTEIPRENLGGRIMDEGASKFDRP